MSKYELIENTVAFYPDNYTKNPIKVGSYKNNVIFLNKEHFLKNNVFEIPILITIGKEVHIHDVENSKLHFLPDTLLKDYKKGKVYLVPAIYLNRENVINKIYTHSEQTGLFN